MRCSSTIQNPKRVGLVYSQKMRHNPAVDPVRFALWTLRDEAAQLVGRNNRRALRRYATQIHPTLAIPQ